MKRVRNFEHVEGREATARQIANILLQFAGTTVEKNVTINSSTEVKVHVNTNLYWSITLSALATSWMAHFGQLMMQDAVRKAVSDADFRPKLLSNESGRI